jgi:hypothetical protein
LKKRGCVLGKNLVMHGFVNGRLILITCTRIFGNASLL